MGTVLCGREMGADPSWGDPALGELGERGGSKRGDVVQFKGLNTNTIIC